MDQLLVLVVRQISFQLQAPHTLDAECSCARRITILVLGLAVVDSGILGEDLNHEERVLIALMQKLALEAHRQCLGVLEPGHLRRRYTAHLH